MTAVPRQEQLPHPAEPRRRSRVARISLLIATAAAAAACGDGPPSPWFAVLRHERLAQVVPGGGMVTLDANLSERDTAFSKVRSVSVVRAFRYPSSAGALHGRQVALQVAAATGWHVNLRRRYTTDPYVGWKRLRLGEATLRIGEYKNGTRYMVTIHLDQGACPPQFCGPH